MLANINDVLWKIATVLIVCTGVYYTFRLKFIQLRFVKMFKYLFKNKETKGISPFKTLMMTLAGRIGIGSIAGVALAIYVGGAGSLFWLLVISFFSTTLSFAESVLGVLYRVKENDVYRGGPSLYIDKGLKQKRLGFLYSAIILFSYLFGFISIQSNTITKVFTASYPISPYLICIVLCLLTIVIIYGGVKKISNFTSKIVPVMAIGYLVIALFVCFSNMHLIPEVINEIVTSAFNFESFFGGFLATLIIGVQRGIFSNEAGLGTGAIASSVSDTNNSVKMGYIQMLGVYITSFVVCSSTAIMILTSPYKDLIINDANGIEITSFSLGYHLGYFGTTVLVIAIFLFAFSTILTGYYYCESSLKYLTKKKIKTKTSILKVLTIISVMAGCLISSSLLWNFVDILIAVIAIINIYALIRLRKDVIKEVKKAKTKHI